MNPHSSTWRVTTYVAILLVVIVAYPYVSGHGIVRTAQAGGRTCGGTLSSLELLETEHMPRSEHSLKQSRTMFVPAQTGESKTWAGQADFLPGTFERTDIITGSQSIVLDRIWSPNQEIGAVSLPPEILHDQPSLTAIGNNVYSIWRQTRSGDSDIFATPIGVAGVAPVRVSDASTAAQEYPSIIGQGTSTLLAVWQDSRSGNPDIIAARSLNGGQTWEPNVRVSTDPGTAPQSRPSVIAGTIAGFCSCWLDGRNGKTDVYFSRSQDGVTWGTNVRVNNDPGSIAQGAPRLATGPNGELYAVWEDLRNGHADIYIARSENGMDWTAGVRVNDDTGTTAQAAPDLAVTTDGEIVVVWRDERNGVPEIWAAGSSDRAASWKPNRRVTGDVLPASLPGVIVDANGLLFTTWASPSGAGANLQAAHSIDKGLNWFLDGPVNDREASVLVGTRAGLAPTAGGPIRAAWGDIRNTSPELWSAFWPAPRLYAPAGIYTSPVLDTRGQASWGALRWDATAPANASLAFEVRAGDTLLPGAGWSAWLPVGAPGASLDSLPRARFFQWRATFGGPGTATPRLNSVTLSWEAATRARAFLPLMQQ